MNNTHHAISNTKLTSFAPDDTSPQYMPDAVFKTEHVSLSLSVSLDKQLVIGSCSLHVKILAEEAKTLTVDAVNLIVSEVTIKSSPKAAKKKLPFKVRDNYIEVTPQVPFPSGSSWIITYSYRIESPRSGIHFLKPDKTYPNRQYQAWTQGESDDARCWFPCRDHPSEKATAEINVTVDKPYMGLANGNLIKTSTKGNQQTFHWRIDRPVAMYLFALAVGEFEEYRPNGTRVPLVYYFPKGAKELAKRGFKKTDAGIRFMEKETGVPYPYNEYAQVALAEFGGGMENTSITFQTDHALLTKEAALDVEGIDSLVVHELAHQWFGDLVTCREWTHGWLNESFATYYEARFYHDDSGPEDFFRRMWGHRAGYFDESYQRPIVTQKWRESFQLFDRHLYEKGACLLHDIRNRMGEGAWKKAVQAYLTQFADGVADTNDLVRSFFNSTGINLDKLFASWVLRPGHPDLWIQSSWDARQKSVLVHIVQKQAMDKGDKLFVMPIEICLIMGKKRITRKVELTDAEHRFILPAPKQPDNVLLDPDWNFLLRTTTDNKPAAMWEAQLIDQHILNRRAAIEHIGSWKNKQSTSLLSRHFKNEKHWWLKAEIIRALAGSEQEKALEFVANQANHTHSKVRTAAIQALAKYGREAWKELFKDRFTHDESIFVRGEALVAWAHLEGKDVEKAIQSAFSQQSWSDHTHMFAVKALATFEGYKKVLQTCFKDGTGQATKIAAMMIVAEKGKGDSQVRQALEKLMKDPSHLVSYVAAMALGKYGDPLAISALQKELKSTGDSILRAKLDAAIRTLRFGSTKDLPTPKKV